MRTEGSRSLSFWFAILSPFLATLTVGSIILPLKVSVELAFAQLSVVKDFDVFVYVEALASAATWTCVRFCVHFKVVSAKHIICTQKVILNILNYRTEKVPF